MSKAIVLLLFIFSTAVNGENLDIAKDFIAEGACPFECCTYRRWEVTKDTQLYERKSQESAKVVIVNIGDSIQALTGDVHVRPLKLTVVKNHKTHLKGDVIWLLNYFGEGYYAAWKAGEHISVELPFSPYQKSKSLDWAVLEGSYKMDWWVKIKSANGLEGWTNEVGNFTNQDSCG